MAIGHFYAYPPSIVGLIHYLATAAVTDDKHYPIEIQTLIDEFSERADFMSKHSAQSGSPEFDAELREYIKRCAIRHHQVCDGFNGTFEDGLNILSRVETDAQRTVFAIYRDRLLMTGSAMPPGLEFLWDPDAYCTYLPAAELREILDADASARFIPRVVESLEAEPAGAGYARMLREWHHFLQTIAQQEWDVYYFELAS